MDTTSHSNIPTFLMCLIFPSPLRKDTLPSLPLLQMTSAFENLHKNAKSQSNTMAVHRVHCPRQYTEHTLIPRAFRAAAKSLQLEPVSVETSDGLQGKRQSKTDSVTTSDCFKDLNGALQFFFSSCFFFILTQSDSLVLC